ncbi:hypothetical protein [Haloterrigena turkmenica]|uniref:hypothetical protein n=1 Tax=Haloterrigena turkmenica TaxID=62320 RepID=UPI001CF7B89A|nr:hypothetical protein [Haloterrigena turkmenica]
MSNEDSIEAAELRFDNVGEALAVVRERCVDERHGVFGAILEDEDSNVVELDGVDTIDDLADRHRVQGVGAYRNKAGPEFPVTCNSSSTTHYGSSLE